MWRFGRKSLFLNEFLFCPITNVYFSYSLPTWWVIGGSYINAQNKHFGTGPVLRCLWSPQEAEPFEIRGMSTLLFLFCPSSKELKAVIWYYSPFCPHNNPMGQVRLRVCDCPKISQSASWLSATLNMGVLGPRPSRYYSALALDAFPWFLSPNLFSLLVSIWASQFSVKLFHRGDFFFLAANGCKGCDEVFSLKCRIITLTWHHKTIRESTLHFVLQFF